MKYFHVLGVSFFCCFAFGWTPASAVGISVEKYVERHMAKFHTTDEGLRAIYQRQLAARYEAIHNGSSSGARDVFFSTPGDQVETQYVLDTLDKAFAQKPEDWATIASALEIAVVGTNEEYLVQRCKNILESIRDVPDDRGDVVWGASQYLLVKRGQEYVSLVVKCVYADYVGVHDETSPTSPDMDKMDSNRNIFRRQAIRALLEYLPLDKQAEVFDQLSRDHPVEAAAPSTWQQSIAVEINVYKDGIERKLRGDIPDSLII